MPGRDSSGTASSSPASRTGSSSLNRRVRDLPPTFTWYRPLVTRVNEVSSSVRNRRRSADPRNSRSSGASNTGTRCRGAARSAPYLTSARADAAPARGQAGRGWVHRHGKSQERRGDDRLPGGQRIRPEDRLEHPRVGQRPLQAGRVLPQPGRFGRRHGGGRPDQPQVRLGNLLPVPVTHRHAIHGENATSPPASRKGPAARPARANIRGRLGRYDPSLKNSAVPDLGSPLVTVGMRQPWLNDARTVPARLVPPWTTCCPGSRGGTPARSRPSATRPRARSTAWSAGSSGTRPGRSR